MLIRTVKPEFWQSESNGRLSRDARLVFVGLFNLADNGGRLRGNVRFLAAQLLPFDADGPRVIEKALVELEVERKIQRYAADGDSYVWITKFSTHQKIDPRYSSRLPAPPIHTDSHHSPPVPTKSTPLDMDMDMDMDQGRGNGTGSAAALSSDDIERDIFDHWRKVMNKNASAQFSRDRREKVRARLAEGRTPVDLKQAIDGCSKTPHNMGENDTGQRWDDLELICRNGANIERFIRNATAPPTRSASRAQQKLTGLEGSGPLTATEGTL